MGTTLTGTQIQNTYDGLIKTTDNTAITATTKLISDGLGNDTCIKVGTAGTDFLGAVDFSAATVSGLPDNNTTYDLASAQAAANVNVNLTGSDATTDTVTIAAGTNITLTDNGSNQITIDASGGGAAGLEAGTGTDSMQSSLTAVPANASGGCSISLGYDADSGSAAVTIGACTNMGDSGVAIGFRAATGATTLTTATVAVGGFSNTGNNDFATALGSCAKITADCSLAVGHAAQACAAGAVNIAPNPRFSNLGAFAACSVAIGSSACVASAALCGVAVGANARAEGNGVALGQNSFNGAQCGNIAIGGGACASATGSEGAGVIGYAGRVCAPRSFGIGYVVRICNVGSTDSIAFGNFASIGNPNGSNAFTCGSALGTNTQVCANSATALGAGVTATRANTVTSCQMEACVAGKGIVVTSPDGLTTLGIGIDNTGAIVTYTP